MAKRMPDSGVSDSDGCCCASSKKDRKSTRLNSSHLGISYAVFCLKKKKEHIGRGAGQRKHEPEGFEDGCTVREHRHHREWSDPSTSSQQDPRFAGMNRIDQLIAY